MITTIVILALLNVISIVLLVSARREAGRCNGLVQLLSGRLHEFNQEAGVELDHDGIVSSIVDDDDLVQAFDQAVARHAAIEQRIRKMAENTPGVFFHYRRDEDGRDSVDYISPGCSKVWELDAAAVEDDAGLIWEQILEEDLEGMHRTLDRSAHNLTPWRYTWRIRTPSGKLKWLQGQSVPEREADGSIGWDAVILDVTDEKEAERKLRESEKRFRNMAANLPGAMFRYEVDPDGRDRVAYMSPGCFDIWEVEAEKVVNDAALLWDMIHPEDIEGMRASVAASARELTPWSFVYRARTPSGKLKWLHGHGRPERLENGGTRWDSLIIEVTAEKEAELAHRLSEARLDSFFSGSSAGLAILDREGRYTHVNPTLATWNRKSIEEHIGRTPDEVLGPGAWEGGAERVRTVIDTGEEMVNVEASMPDTEFDGLRHCIYSLFPIRGTDSVEVIGVGAVVLETTALKEAEAARDQLESQLAHAQRLESIGRLAGGIAHDFNNMLTVIIGHCELAIEELPFGSTSRGSLEQVLLAARRSADLTGELLAFARKQPGEPMLLDLNEEVERAVTLLRHLVGETIELTHSPTRKSGKVEIDAAQISQIVTNLVVNSRDAIEDSGKIVVSTGVVEIGEDRPARAAPGRYLFVEVEDDGRGMGPDTRDRIFEPFFTTKGIGEGTGLGLSTVHGIVAQNGGFIDVDSRPGEGTRFRVHLPEARAVERSRSESDEPPVESMAGTLLVVEDEPAILALTSSILERQGYRVLTAQDPKEALALFEADEDEIDLLVTDVIMPGMNGRALAKSMRERQPDLRVLYLSGYSGEALDGKLGEEEQTEAFLSKPFTSNQLAKRVRELLDEPLNR